MTTYTRVCEVCGRSIRDCFVTVRETDPKKQCDCRNRFREMCTSCFLLSLARHNPYASMIPGSQLTHLAISTVEFMEWEAGVAGARKRLDSSRAILEKLQDEDKT